MDDFYYNYGIGKSVHRTSYIIAKAIYEKEHENSQNLYHPDKYFIDNILPITVTLSSTQLGN